MKDKLNLMVKKIIKLLFSKKKKNYYIYIYIYIYYIYLYIKINKLINL